MRAARAMLRPHSAAALACALVSLCAADALCAPAVAGVVKVTTDPAGATVHADGVPYGPTPVLFELSQGRHTLIVTRVGCKPVTREVVVRKDRVSRIHFALAMESPEAPRVHDTKDGGADSGPGTVTITTEPPGLEVLVDGVPVPLPTPVAFDLPAGAHELRIERNGELVYRKVVFVVAGETEELEVDLASRRRIDESDPWK
ncbi:MAG: PEGA domain-containing protein [Proteobacteria bacterium]|nr:PEGA domain-containing protein [Pseudomonadota bacterium]